jgi:hypothetical protein
MQTGLVAEAIELHLSLATIVSPAWDGFPVYDPKFNVVLVPLNVAATPLLVTVLAGKVPLGIF